MTRSSSQSSPDDIDRAFSQYFRAQLPTRFPEPPIPADATPAPTARGGWWRSRLTLGASVAALLALGFAVSYGPTVGDQPKPKGNGYDQTGTANGNIIKKHMDMNEVPPMDMR